MPSEKQDRAEREDWHDEFYRTNGKTFEEEAEDSATALGVVLAVLVVLLIFVVIRLIAYFT